MPSERNEDSQEHRHSCYIEAKKLAIFCPCHKSLGEAGLLRNGLHVHLKTGGIQPVYNGYGLLLTQRRYQSVQFVKQKEHEQAES